MIFVFGSNLAGRHGAGGALHAMEKYGAIYGQGIGFQGQSYAIPTKDENFNVLPLEIIREHVRDFLFFAHRHPEMEFIVTAIGCGLAGYKYHQIGPFFRGAPNNCILPEEFTNAINKVLNLEEMTKLSQEMGLYDPPFENPLIKDKK